jgi:hypothetical protein
MRARAAFWTMIGAVAMAVLLATAPGLEAGAPRTLAALERDIGAAMAHATVLRERLAAAPLLDPLAPDPHLPDPLAPQPSRAADIAGIADGGGRSSLAALRLATRAIDRRLETLRASLPTEPPERTEIMLIMRSALGSVLWTIEDLPLAAAEVTDTAPTRDALLDRLDRSLGDLATATAAMAAFQW